MFSQAAFGEQLCLFSRHSSTSLESDKIMFETWKVFSAPLGSLFSDRFPMCSSSIVFSVRVIVVCLAYCFVNQSNDILRELLHDPYFHEWNLSPIFPLFTFCKTAGRSSVIYGTHVILTFLTIAACESRLAFTRVAFRGEAIQARSIMKAGVVSANVLSGFGMSCTSMYPSLFYYIFFP